MSLSFLPFYDCFLERDFFFSSGGYLFNDEKKKPCKNVWGFKGQGSSQFREIQKYNINNPSDYVSFKSVLEASKSVEKGHIGCIIACCKGQRKTHKGFGWRFSKDYDKKDI